MSRHSDSRDQAPAAACRWPGPTAEELSGQRARRRSAGDVDDRTLTTDAVAVPELPDLEDGVYLLEPAREGRRRRREAVLGPLQGLALDAAFARSGDVVWIDAGGHASTHVLASVAPSRRALDRVHVARAFTAHQHHTLLEDLRRWLGDAATGPFGGPATDRPAVVVCPAVDALYRGSDLPERAATPLLARALAVCRSFAREHGLPVVLTRSRGGDVADEGARAVERAATTISLVETEHGARLACPALAFETLAYDVGDGLVQTTLAFWREVLGARHPDVAAVDSPAPTPITPGTEG